MRYATALSLIVFLLLGCSAFRPWTQSISVITTAPKADVWINAQLIGKSPVFTRVRRDKNVSIVVRKEGFRSTAMVVNTLPSKTGEFDRVFGPLFLLPLIGLAFPGSHSIEQQNIVVPMEPAD